MKRWRLALSLAMLRDQLNSKWPQRDKSADGTIGDLSHRGRVSDHNPNSEGTVCAMDITHDVAGGVNGSDLSEQLIKDPRVKYVIWHGHIYKARLPHLGWQRYRGSNPHDHHVHISVTQESADDTGKWLI